MIDHICQHCNKTFRADPSAKRKNCSLKCANEAQRIAKTMTTPEYRALRKIWCDMRRYADKEIEPGVSTAEIDIGWKASFFIFQRWAQSVGYVAGQRFARRDKTKGYEPSNCHFIKEVVKC